MSEPIDMQHLTPDQQAVLERIRREYADRCYDALGRYSDALMDAKEQAQHELKRGGFDPEAVEL